MTAPMSQFPLNLEPPEALQRARGFFREIGFDAAELCRRVGIADMSSIGEVSWKSGVLDALEPRLRACVDLFLRGSPLPADAVRECFGADVVDAFSALGLLRHSQRVPGALTCPVWVYPVEEFVVASDRRDRPDDETIAPGNDVVFPAIYGLTARFLDLLPDAAGRDALDLCGGTGIGAMVMARNARSATTSDLAGRAARFAEFNARLNGVPVDSVCGDLYEPVAGRTFDVVVAHPPFVPEFGEHMIFRDAGETGEDVIRRIVEDLPRHLRAAGTCVIVCWARDTTKAAFEQRVVAWLGGKAGEFDVIFGAEKTQSLDELVDVFRRNRKMSPNEARGFGERLKQLDTLRFVYGALLLVRREPADTVPAAPGRVGIARSVRMPEFEKLLRWRRLRRRPDFAARLRRSRPRLVANLEFDIHHEVRDGELTALSHTFSTDAPFRSRVRVDGWMVPLITRMVGQDTVEEVFRQLTAAGGLKRGFPLEAYLELVADAVEKAFLHVELAD